MRKMPACFSIREENIAFSAVFLEFASTQRAVMP
jgi:hypothetical protein